MSQNRDIYIAFGVGALFFLLSQKSASAQTVAGATGTDNTTNGLLGILNNLTKPKPATPASASKPSSGSGGGSGSGATSAAAALKAAQAKAQAMLAAIGKAASNGFNTPLGTTDDSSTYSNDYLGFGDAGTYSPPDLSDRLGNGLDDGASVTVTQTDNGYGDFTTGGGGGNWNTTFGVFSESPQLYDDPSAYEMYGNYGEW